MAAWTGQALCMCLDKKVGMFAGSSGLRLEGPCNDLGAAVVPLYVVSKLESVSSSFHARSG